MEHLTREAIHRALGALAAALPSGDSPRELWIVGGAALVLLYGARETTKDVDAFDVGDARLLLSKLAGDKASVWTQVEPEADRGPA